MAVRREWSLYEVKYWYLEDYSCITVPRNKDWFKAALPKIQETWDTILKERDSGYEHRASKKRIPKQVRRKSNVPTESRRRTPTK
jgi:hypothetical protein